MIGNTISYNTVWGSGGGLVVDYDSSVIYNESNLNNIYLNYSIDGCDLKINNENGYQHIILDTFTVFNPGRYFASITNTNGEHLEGLLDFSIQNAKIEQVSGNLFVSPEGSNYNSGITEDDPLKTISYALTKSRPIENDRDTIFIADGVYSASLTNEIFPLYAKDNVSLIGESAQNTILDAENQNNFLKGYWSGNNISVSDLTFINSYGEEPIFFQEVSGIMIQNILIENSTCTSLSILDLTNCNFDISDCIIQNNLGGIGMVLRPKGYCLVSSCIVKNNDHLIHPNVFSAGALVVNVSPQDVDSCFVDIINTEMTNNRDNCTEWPLSRSALSVNYGKVNVVNCTIGNNITSEPFGGAVKISDEADVSIYNSIIYGNTPDEIFLDGRYGANNLYVQNSLVLGGEFNIGMWGTNYIDWANNNIDEDPLWIGDGYFPYSLDNFSPCINAGSLNIPDGIELPEYDLAGNPRIFGNTIDIGAYEYQGVDNDENTSYSSQKTQINAYPNPFSLTNQNRETIQISYYLPESDHVSLNIYNLKGQAIKTLISEKQKSGNHEISWNGFTDNNKKVATGVYFYKLETEKKSISRKMIIIR